MATPPVFVKVNQLSPSSTGGHTLLAKVLSSKTVRRKARAAAIPAARRTRIECLIGDDTGCILFIAPSDEVDMLKPGNTVVIRDAKISMSKGIIKLLVDRRGLVEVTGPASFDVKEDNNVSLVEYELVCI